MKKVTKTVSIYDLGICEHCDALLHINDVWRANKRNACPHCRKVVTKHSFGFNEDRERVRWVGPRGNWVKNKPRKNFVLNPPAQSAYTHINVWTKKPKDDE